MWGKYLNYKSLSVFRTRFVNLIVDYDVPYTCKKSNWIMNVYMHMLRAVNRLYHIHNQKLLCNRNVYLTHYSNRIVLLSKLNFLCLKQFFFFVLFVFLLSTWTCWWNMRTCKVFFISCPRHRRIEKSGKLHKNATWSLSLSFSFFVPFCQLLHSTAIFSLVYVSLCLSVKLSDYTEFS